VVFLASGSWSDRNLSLYDYLLLVSVPFLFFLLFFLVVSSRVTKKSFIYFVTGFSDSTILDNTSVLLSLIS
jgi:hypothetical protein